MRTVRAPVPDTPIVYQDVELLEQDGLGFTCRIGNERIFVGKYVPLEGTTIRASGDRGQLALPRWFVEQQGLPLELHLSDHEVDDWFETARANATTAQEHAERYPNDPAAQAALDRAMVELSAAMVVRTRRQGAPR
jgi:hypothetical protein